MPPHEYFLPDFLPGKIKYKVSDGVWCDLPVIAQAMVYDLASGRDATGTSAYWIHGDDAIEICSHENGIPVSYFFTHDVGFKPGDILKEVEEICETFAVGVE